VDHPAVLDASLRLKRADEHFAALDRERRAFLEDATSGIVGEFEPDTSQYVFWIEGQPPREWSPILSDFIHQQRAALDNLVCALVEHRGNTVTTKTSFPIALTREWWRGSRCRAKMSGLTTGDKATIKTLQPFKRWDEDPFLHDPLAWLLWLSNADKHRALHGVYVSSVGWPEPEPGDQFPVHSTDREDVGEIVGIEIGAKWNPQSPRTEIVRYRLKDPGPNPKMGVQGDLGFDVAISDLNTILKYEGLMMIRKDVEGALEALAPQFA
jgi:hypothetical protein